MDYKNNFTNYSDFEDDYDDYIENIHNNQINNFKKQFDFSQKLKSIENNVNDEDNINIKFQEPIEVEEKKTKQNTIYVYSKNNEIESLIQQFKDEKLIKIEATKNKRRSCNEINKKLEAFFDNNSVKWDKEYIKTISKKTNLPVNTIYKWNWNKIKTINK